MRPLASVGNSDKNRYSNSSADGEPNTCRGESTKAQHDRTQKGKHCGLSKPLCPRGIVVDQHLMGESPEDCKTGKFGLLDDKECQREERWDNDRCPRGSGQAGKAPLMSG